jgi:hypothetical protein
MNAPYEAVRPEKTVVLRMLRYIAPERGSERFQKPELSCRSPVRDRAISHWTGTSEAILAPTIPAVRI